MDKVKIGFVGVGRMGQAAHLKSYVTVPDCEVVAIAELRGSLGKAVAARYGVPRVYKTHEEMLSAEKLDGIVASQPFRRHGVLVPELLKVGAPVFIEKPLAGSVEVGQRIVQAVTKSETWLMVGYHKRSDPAAVCAKAQIDKLNESGELGPLRYVRMTMPEGDWVAEGFADLITTDEPLPQLEYDPPASDMDEATYREYEDFVNYYIHQINLLRYLMGEPYGVTYADSSGVLLAVQSDSGVAGVIEMSPYATTRDWQESALVGFEQGYVKLSLPAPLASNRPGSVEIFRDSRGDAAPRTIVPRLPRVHAMRQQAMNFVAAVKGEARPPCEAQEALEDLTAARQYVRLLKGR